MGGESLNACATESPIAINHSFLPKGSSYTANSAFSTLPSSQASSASNFLPHLPYLLEHGSANHDTEGKRFKSPIHCCDVTNPPYLFSGELYTSPLHCKLLFVYTVCFRRTGQCFSVLRTRKFDVILMQWTAVVGEVTSPNSDTTCHSCAPMF